VEEENLNKIKPAKIISLLFFVKRKTALLLGFV
jgi:hypothetical protein